MSIRTALILFCLFMGTLALNGQVSVKEITENPWPFEATPINIADNYGEFLKQGKYTLKSKYDRSGKDTIIRFYKGKSKVFFYRPVNSYAFFLGATLYDPRIKLKGGISAGITRQELLTRIAWPENNSDTIRVSLPNGAYHTSFIMKNNKVNHIKIEARNKKR